MYWNPFTALPQITNALKGGLTRFETLKRYLHFNDNSGPDGRCFHAAWAVSKSAH